MLLALLLSTALADTPATNCKWCIDSDKKVKTEVLGLAKLAPDEQLRELRKKNVCVKILASGRPVLKKFFHWGEMEKPSGKLSEITVQKALLGKTLCKGELPLSKDCMTIALADDAPLSTLLHEYLHVKQTEKDADWCALSKELWSRKPSDSENQLIRDKEWDAHRFLWRNRSKLKFGLEDELAVASELIEETAARATWDPNGVEFINKENIIRRVQELILEYKKKVGIK